MDSTDSAGQFVGIETDWANPPTLKDLKQDLEAARPGHDSHVRDVNRWRGLRDAEKQAPKKSDRSSIQPKLVRRQAEWRYSALSEPFLSSQDLFKVSGRTFEDVEKARKNALVLNYQTRNQMDRVSFIDEYVRAATDEGSAILRTGWNLETRKITEEEPIWEYIEAQDPEAYARLVAAVELATENPNEFWDLPEDLQEAVRYFQEHGQAVVAEIVGYETVHTEEVIANHPEAELIDPENIFIDPACKKEIKKARFVITTQEMAKTDLVKNPNFKNIERIQWGKTKIHGNQDYTPPEDESTRATDVSGEARKTTVVYEYWGYWDIHGDDIAVPIVACWVDDILIRLEESPYPHKELPFVLVPYMPRLRKLTGEPDAELLEDNQAILGALTRGMIDLMGRSANAQQGIPKGLLDTMNRRRWERGDDYEYNPQLGNPQQAILTHKYPEIPNSALLMLNMQNQEAEALTGVKAFSGGMSGESYGDVVAGIRGVLDAASKREMAILRRLAAGIESVGKHFIAMNQVFLSEEEQVRITNEEFETVRREDIQGNFDLIVDIATAEVDEARAQDLVKMLQTMGQTLPFDMVKTILAEIARLKRMPDLAKHIEKFSPQPDPLEQKETELRIAKLQAEIEKINADAEKSLATARKAISEADVSDLKFVEQESGVTHEREIQKQQAQSEGNQKMEMTKAILDPNTPNENVARAAGFNALTRNRDMAG